MTSLLFCRDEASGGRLIITSRLRKMGVFRVVWRVVFVRVLSEFWGRTIKKNY
jgi:hypothetical protein